MDPKASTERRAITHSYLAKTLFRYPYTHNLIHELQARPNLRLICDLACNKASPRNLRSLVPLQNLLLPIWAK